MDEAFTYKDRLTFYKKDMWRSNIVIQTLIEELKAAKDAGKDHLRIGNREIKIEALESLIKCQEVQNILHDRIRAAAALLNMPNPNDIFFLDLDADAESKRISEEKQWRMKREEEYEKSVREEEKKT
jgi:hypothetical protein